MSKGIKLIILEGEHIYLYIHSERLYFTINESGASEYHKGEVNFSLTGFECDVLVSIIEKVRNKLKDA